MSTTNGTYGKAVVLVFPRVPWYELGEDQQDEYTMVSPAMDNLLGTCVCIYVIPFVPSVVDCEVLPSHLLPGCTWCNTMFDF